MSPGLIEREILLAPDLLARAAASAVSGRAERWMLTQPRRVRASYVREVLDRGGGQHAQVTWMLRQGEGVRASYLRDVAAFDGSPPEVRWMLRQSDAVRESYITEVLTRG
ncbi:MAG TPA: hypothetical protein VHX88_00555 [Solirubrobacteraceae bacterium]|jgi:hypothetical protein|nr:hypothetical protein [Solirubrobacteraceae bacterium]